MKITFFLFFCTVTFDEQLVILIVAEKCVVFLIQRKATFSDNYAMFCLLLKQFNSKPTCYALNSNHTHNQRFILTSKVKMTKMSLSSEIGAPIVGAAVASRHYNVDRV